MNTIILAKDVAGLIFQEIQMAVRDTMPEASPAEVARAETALICALAGVKSPVL